MARHVGADNVGGRIEDAVARVLRSGRALPADLGGSASLSEVEAAIQKELLWERAAAFAAT
jgi:isocitrate/isopropylmalate dehydrogenase